jgi:hypothetical protein
MKIIVIDQTKVLAFKDYPNGECFTRIHGSIVYLKIPPCYSAGLFYNCLNVSSKALFFFNDTDSIMPKDSELILTDPKD